MSGLSVDIRHIGIIGTGKMGMSLFEYFLDRNFELTWLARTGERADELSIKTDKRLKRFLKYGLKTEQEIVDCRLRFRLSANYHSLIDVDLVIETVTEDVDIKKDVLIKAFEHIPGHALVATNSSSIMPCELSDRKIDLSRLLGMHFFFPVETTRVVEIIVHRSFNNAAFGKIKEFLNKAELLPIYQDEKNAFLINMLSMPVAGGAFNLAKKVGFQEANRLASSELFPMGPFYLFDHVGIDIIIEANKRYRKRDLLKNRDSYAELMYFMRLMRLAGKRGDRNLTKFLGGALNYPDELPQWRQQKRYRHYEFENEEPEKNKERLVGSLIATFHNAIERKLIDPEKLDEAWRNIMGSTKGLSQITEERRRAQRGGNELIDADDMKMNQ